MMPFLTDLKPMFKDLPFSVAEENIQSRTRGNLLMAIANKFGYILLNTSNKSELANLIKLRSSSGLELVELVNDW